MIRFTPSDANQLVWSELDNFIKQVEKPSKQSVRPVADAVRWGFAENFADERAGDEGNWEPLSARTVAERVSQGYGGEHPILKRSGDYEDSFTNPSDADHVEILETTGSGWDLFVGSQDDRVDILEVGGWHNGSFVPARPVLFLGDDQEYLIGTTLDEFFMNLAY